MRALRRLVAKLAGLFRKSRSERELDREINSHLEFLEEQFQAQGMTPAEARRAARMAYGGVEQAKQLHRDERSLLWAERSWRYARFACRQARTSPGFSLTVILTLALGIGTSTAVFSLIDGILLRPLPFHEPGRLVLLGDRLGKGLNLGVTAREIEEYENASRAFSSVGAFESAGFELSTGAIPEVLHGAELTAGVFPTLGVQPVIGRVFTRQEQEARSPVVVISYAMWTERFHQDPSVLGRSIDLNRRPRSIIGVMPRGFEFPLQTGRLDQGMLWTPLSLTPEDLAQDGAWRFEMVARLKNGVTLSQASQDASRVAVQVMRDFPSSVSAIRIQGDVMPLHEYAVRDARPLLKTLLFAASTVLLMACLNAAVLLLVRAIRRRREYAVRLALGAPSNAIVVESALEGLVLSLCGGVLGLLLVAFAIHSALHMLPDSMPRINSISTNVGVVVFALVLSLITGIACSCVPAFAAAQTSLLDSLTEGSHTGTGGRSHARLRSALVVVEVGVAVLLLILSGAFLRSYQKMLAVDPGFQPEHVLVAEYGLPAKQYNSNAAIDSFNHEVVRRLSSKSGVVAAAISTAIPASGSAASGYTVEGVPPGKWKLQFSNFAIVSGDYFRALGIPLLAGRYFNADDRTGAPPVVIVNESMARQCWPGEDAIGKHIHAGNPRRPYPWATVVGVVADTKPQGRDQPGAEQWYIPTEQPEVLNGAASAEAVAQTSAGYIILRAALPPEQMIGVLRATVASIDPLLGLDQIRTMNEAIANVEAPRRFNTGLLTVFAICSLMLALTGIYAVVAFSVSLRTREIAVRMALGAQRGNVVRMVLVSGGKLVSLGCVLGLAGSVVVSRLISSFLFEVSPTDPLIWAASVLFMMFIAALASALPAKRAASTEPVETLRLS
jgi:predicted permease